MKLSNVYTGIALATALSYSGSNAIAESNTNTKAIEIAKICSDAGGDSMNRVQREELKDCKYTNQDGVCFSPNAIRIGLNVMNRCLMVYVGQVSQIEKEVQQSETQKERFKDMSEAEKIKFYDRWDGAYAFEAEMGFPKKILDVLKKK